MEATVPLIDFSEPESAATTAAIRKACKRLGFFYLTNHGVAQGLVDELVHLSREFFAWPQEQKLKLRMELGGPAWRGYFPVGQELTSGKPDQKEGLYLGAELPVEDPRVKAGTPLHGPNLIPAITGFRETLLEYLQAMTELGQRVLASIALSLSLPGNAFSAALTRDPLILFRIFHYPALKLPTASEEAEEQELPWSVGEHTDYGLLTILYQDQAGGLEVKTPQGWIQAPPVPGSFVCNLGDMLDRLCGGRYRSTPHRVRNRSNQDRLSMPFFLDPGFDAAVEPLLEPLTAEQADDRWDKVSVRDSFPTYGDYLLRKIGKVFPGLKSSTLE